MLYLLAQSFNDRPREFDTNDVILGSVCCLCLTAVAMMFIWRFFK